MMQSIAVTIAIAGSLALADQVKVEKDAVLRKSKTTVSAVVAPLKKGEMLEVTRREDKWLFGQAQGKQGWAHESWIKDGGSFAGVLKSADVAVTGDARAAAAGEGAAAKGLGPTARQFAASKGYSGAELDRLVSLRTRIIDSGEWEQFAREGKVGPAEMRQ
jgi:hypothetical protein